MTQDSLLTLNKVTSPKGEYLKKKKISVLLARKWDDGTQEGNQHCPITS